MKIANFALLLSLLTTIIAKEWGMVGINGSHEQVELLRSLNAAKPSHDEENEGTVLSYNTTRRDNYLANTELVIAFVMTRHGDRTPSKYELSYISTEKANWTKVLFPYGNRALTNKGKLRSYYVGKYLRERYDGFISRMYLTDEVLLRSTDYERSKMGVLAILAAMYRPTREQKWIRDLDWQPVPYDTLPSDVDNLVFWKNCPKYLVLTQQNYANPVIKDKMKLYGKSLKELREATKFNFTTPLQVWFLESLFEGLNNVKYPIPRWHEKLLPEIKAIVKLELAAETFNQDVLRLTTGVVLNDIVKASNSAVSGNILQPKLRLYSAHSQNMVGLLAALGLCDLHQPRYGSTISLELRVHRRTGEYGMAAVYAPEAGGPGQILPIYGCSGALICEYETFRALTKNITISYNDYKTECHS